MKRKPMTPLSRKRFLTKRHCALFLLALMSLSLFGCAAQSNKKVLYGTVETQQGSLLFVLSSEARAYTDELYGEYNAFPNMLFHFGKAGVHITLSDISELKLPVTYATDNVDDYYLPPSSANKTGFYPVVTTKWWYYSSSSFFSKNFVVDKTFIENVINDEYCMEKVTFDWFSFVVDDEKSPYYGMTWREMSKSLEDEHENCLNAVSTTGKYMWYPYVEKSDPNTWGICFKYQNELRSAAVARYGMDIGEDLPGVGELEVCIPFEKKKEDGTAYIANYKNICLYVVGYVETEADKLLSTGVSMDKNSDEYKIVMEQLKNPVFYSVCGNFLEGLAE